MPWRVNDSAVRVLGDKTLRLIVQDLVKAVRASVTPQETIKQGLPKPSECDIVSVIFWSRLGTPLPSALIPIGDLGISFGAAKNAPCRLATGATPVAYSMRDIYEF